MKLIKVARVVMVVGLLSSLNVGCAKNYNLVMKPDLEPVRDSAVSQELGSAGYRKAIIVPPVGAEVGKYEFIVAAFQKEFIEAGFSLASSAQIAAATSQNDVDSAIQRAKDSGAEVAVVIQRFEWSDEAEPSRFFVLESLEHDTFREVDAAAYRLASGHKYAFSAPVLRFTGRITSVENLEVLATFQAEIAANWSLPQVYEAELELTEDDGSWEIVSQNFDYADDWWIAAAKKVCENKILDEISGSFQKRVGDRPTAQPETPAAQPAPPGQ